MLEPHYTIEDILCFDPEEGSTDPRHATLYAVVKRDCLECPHNVYDEIVAVKLGRALQVSIEEGVLTPINDELLFASLRLFYLGHASVPNMIEDQRSRVAEKYPLESARLTAFDVLIGNRDRMENIKAVLSDGYHPIFCGFDHNCCLLDARNSAAESIECLDSGELVVKFHPFYGHILADMILKEAVRIQELVTTCNDLITDSFIVGHDVGQATLAIQKRLAEVMLNRTKSLPEIIEKNIEVVNKST